MNIQPIEKRVIALDGKLAVHSIFQTIQGEGPFCGVPCVFVRLAGCNLQCPACDTDYTGTRQAMTPCEVLFEVNVRWRADGWRRGLVVVTGGEPFRQDLHGLFNVLTEAGYDVQVETNGTLAPTRWPYQAYVSSGDAVDPRGQVYVVCSPKTPKLHPEVLAWACALKYVVTAGHASGKDGLPNTVLGLPNPACRPPEGWDRPVYVQPMDCGDELDNTRHVREAVASCLRHGYTLQLQIHKMIGVE